ncbi:hypothetical protein [Flagellimonas beolgyonensis]|uniref:hypothetical protein n=1 Tax=Flagellimonas beolgyonensis TaxID=864064 RepID=UPI003D64AC63
MQKPYNTLVKLTGIVFWVLNNSTSLAQTNEAYHRLDQFVNASCETTFEEIQSDALSQILEFKVYHIKKDINHLYGEKEKRSVMFIVIDNGTQVKSFERIKSDTELPELLSYIRRDFSLDENTAPLFETMLDHIYPVEDWKPDKREFFFLNGKWYFLRDAYFRTKQGFEVTVDANGKITGIRYKMKWNENNDS